MEYEINKLLILFVGAMLASGGLAALNVLLSRWCNWRVVVREDAPSRHRLKQGTPSLGGLSLLTVVLALSLLTVRMEQAGGWRVLAVLWLMVMLAAVGFIDDYLKLRQQSTLGIKARWRIILQVLVALGFTWFITAGDGGGPALLGFSGLSGPLRVVLGTFVIVGSVNAVNLTDGLDGLAAGLVGISAMALGVICWITGLGQLAVLSAVVAGAAVGFLWLNTHPAQIFMGDVGSLGLGALLGGIAVAGAIELVFAVVAIVFVVEALTVIIQVLSFRWAGQRVFAMTPIHHAFELRGWTEPQIVVRFWIIGLAAGVVGVVIAAGL